ncbi:MAG: ribonuclease Z [Fervidicoccaceae archaeon]
MSDAWLIFLGTAAGVPSGGSGMPGILLQYRGKYILLDAGEGTQISLSRLGIGSAKIDAILVSHLHGDHIFGLPGLIQTMSMESRTRPLLVISPAEIRSFLDASFRITSFTPSFEIKVEEPSRLSIGDAIDVVPFRTCHTISPSFGYLLVGKSHGGKVRFSLAYTGDTMPCDSYRDAIRGAEILIHDSTFSEEVGAEAWNYGHSTSRDAALLARDIGARILFLFHISSRYSSDPLVLEREARRIFPMSFLAKDGMKFYL